MASFLEVRGLERVDFATKRRRERLCWVIGEVRFVTVCVMHTDAPSVMPSWLEKSQPKPNVVHCGPIDPCTAARFVTEDHPACPIPG